MSNPNVIIDRNKYIGGSDLPSILGLNTKYGVNAFEFAKQKAGIVPSPFSGNQFTKYGQLMEPVIRDYINSITGANYLEDTIIDSDRGYRGNTDGIDRSAEIPILEVKTFGEELDVNYYAPQCQFYMEAFNQESCLLVGYKRPTDFYKGIDYDLENTEGYFNLEFDENRIVKHIIKRDKKLWEQINNRIIAFKKGVEYLREHKEDFTETSFNDIFYGNELMVLTNKIAELEATLDNYKKIENEHKNIKEKLYNLFEEKGLISLDTGTMKITKIAPVSYETTTIDSAKLQLDLPDLYEQYKVNKKVNKKGYILVTKKSKEDK
jgi:hypothetical protein